MSRVRGILMLLAAAVAFWRGWQIHVGRNALLAYSLSAVALGLALWHLTRKPDKPRLYGNTNSGGKRPESTRPDGTNPGSVNE